MLPRFWRPSSACSAAVAYCVWVARAFAADDNNIWLNSCWLCYCRNIWQTWKISNGWKYRRESLVLIQMLIGLWVIGFGVQTTSEFLTMWLPLSCSCYWSALLHVQSHVDIWLRLDKDNAFLRHIWWKPTPGWLIVHEQYTA